MIRSTVLGSSLRNWSCVCFWFEVRFFFWFFARVDDFDFRLGLKILISGQGFSCLLMTFTTTRKYLFWIVMNVIGCSQCYVDKMHTSGRFTFSVVFYLVFTMYSLVISGRCICMSWCLQYAQWLDILYSMCSHRDRNMQSGCSQYDNKLFTKRFTMLEWWWVDEGNTFIKFHNDFLLGHEVGERERESRVI